MRVLVLGGYGLIGSQVMATLHGAGHELVALGRRPKLAMRRFPYARWAALDLARPQSAERWRELARGCDAVVNCAGALQEVRGAALEAIHVTNPNRLWQACAAEGVRRAVLVSAVGLDGDTPFARTKLRGEERLQSSGLDWFILRPALVLGPTVYGGSALLRGLAGLPWVTPVWRGDAPVHTVDVADIARTVEYCLRRDVPARQVFDLAHPEPRTLGEILLALRRCHGFAPQPVLALPDLPVRWLGRIADAGAWLGWRSPLRTTALDQLASGITADPGPWLRATGIQPRALPQILAAHPAGVQDGWFARCYFLKPVAIFGLSLFWIATGLVAIGPGRVPAQAMLRDAGLSEMAAAGLAIAGALLDLVLGVLLLHRRSAPLALRGMLALCLLYLLAGTVLAPALWLDPLGPLLKILPVILAILACSAILDDR